MSKVNIAIIYYSSTGTNYNMANIARETAAAEGANVRLLKVPELAPEEAIASNPAWNKHYNDTKSIPNATPADIEWADAIIFSVPTRFGNIPSQMKQFLDTTGGLWAQGKTANKVVSAMSSAQNPNGGQEQTVLSLYTSMYHWGAIVVAPGFTDNSIPEAGGNPYGVSVTATEDGSVPDKSKKAIQHQARRVVKVASTFKLGESAKATVSQ